MFSKTCEYAIRAMLYIAQKTRDGSRVGFKEIAAGIDAPEHFTAKILQELSRKDLVQSLKGPNGGFYHNAATLQKSLADIVRTIDGDKLFSGCALGLKQCSEVHPCPVHNEFKKIRKNIKTMLEKTRLGEFSTKLDEQLVFLKH